MEATRHQTKSINTQKNPVLGGLQMISADNFADLVLKGEGPIIVEFMSYTCGHCEVMEPILKQVAETLKSKTKIYQMDFDADPEFGTRYGVQGTPTFIMFLNGKTIGRAAGPSPVAATLIKALSQPFGDI